jgi:hypothetical protein
MKKWKTNSESGESNMQHSIRRYPVQHPLLKKYIKFFWEIHAENMQLNHKILPQRNISLRFNLNDTPQFVCFDEKERLLEGSGHKVDTNIHHTFVRIFGIG